MNAVVKTQHGEVRGSAADSVNTFKGIPYAPPPFGANRLGPPQPVAPWSGIRDALAFGPTPLSSRSRRCSARWSPRPFHLGCVTRLARHSRGQPE